MFPPRFFVYIQTLSDGGVVGFSGGSVGFGCGLFRYRPVSIRGFGESGK